jgi:hypothetical protein
MKKNRISEASLKKNIYVQVKCGDYSYAGPLPSILLFPACPAFT